MNWEKVNKTDTCWLWTGAINWAGYGVVDGKGTRAHRVSFFEAGKSLGLGEIVRHTCHVRRCVNPDHLIPGSHKQNAQDRVLAGRNNHVAGVNHPLAKMNPGLVRMIRAMVRWSSRRRIAALFRIDRKTLADILARRTWRDI